ncbi:MAG: YjbQ family protein [Pararhodobacter sp.]|nr:YjbQ family protein [Pararhodobacter sp.]
MHRVFTIATDGPGLYEITDAVQNWLKGAPKGEGVLTLFIRHTSASLVIQENADPSVQRDLAGFFERLAPPADHPSMGWITHRAEGPDDMPAHLKAAVLPTSLQIPVIDGRMMLGTWQGIYTFEHRTRPHRREVVAVLR